MTRLRRRVTSAGVRAAAALAIITALLAGAFATASSARLRCEDRLQVQVFGDWTIIRSPFDFGDVAAYAVDPVLTDVIYVSDGIEVMKSVDGGCTFGSVFSLASAPPAEFPGYNQFATRIKDIVIPMSTKGRERVFLLVNTGGETPVGAVGASAVAVSDDGGRTWSAANNGLPVGANPESIAIAPTDPDVGYLTMNLLDGGSALMRTADGGSSWTVASQVTQARESPWRQIMVDPLDPDTVWAWGGQCLCRSRDGGATFERLLVVSTGIPAAEIFHVRGSPPRLLAFTTSALYYRSDDGGKEWSTGTTPDRVVSATHGRTKDEIAVATDQTASRSMYGFVSEERAWRSIALGSFGQITDLTTDATADPSVFGRSKEAIVKFSGQLAARTQDLSTFIVTPGRPSQTIRECPPPGPPAQWLPTYDPVPPEDGPVYVANFDSGELIAFDRHGTGTTVAIGPKYSEGITLDPIGRVIATTRFSNQVMRLYPSSCKLEALDYDLFTAEGPTYDLNGDLYVVSTDTFFIWKYPWPQHPRQKPTLVYRMPGFLEDLKIATAGPFKGHMFVLYRDRRNDIDDGRVCSLAPCPMTGHPNAVALLKPTNDPKSKGWKRIDDFTSLGVSGNDGATGNCTGFATLGIALTKTGSLLAGDSCGSGVIREYSPDGSEWRVFGRVSLNTEGPLYLTKIAVGASGHVYVTGNTALNSVENSASFVFRFDESGRELQPPFSQRLTLGVGVAVLPAPLLPDRPALPPVTDVPPAPHPVPLRAAGVLPPPPPPPVPPVVTGAPGPAPVTQMAPAQAPAPAPASQANPMAAAVPQQQEQPQLAFVMAANALKEQAAEQYAMAGVTRPADPLRGSRYALVVGAVSLVAAFGYVSLGIARARVAAAKIFDR